MSLMCGIAKSAILLAGISVLLPGCVLPAPFRVMSFNIRTAEANDGPNGWDLRRALLIETIQAQQPDILGLQEVAAQQADDLHAALPGYGYFGTGRDDAEGHGEGVPILYRQARFTLLDSGRFWLSEHPESAGSMGWDAACPRMATWVRLRFKDAPLADVTVINVHLDHRGKQARLESAKLLRRVIESQGGRPVVLLGDFNCRQASPPYEILTADRGNLAELLDSVPLAAPGFAAGTFHGFTGQAKEGRIDWILVNRTFEAVQCGIDRSNRDGRYPSDHFPVTATLRMCASGCGSGSG
jgi:endonuclease/exonuclease/phosphatase family metal-dependent hydrolase